MLFLCRQRIPNSSISSTSRFVLRLASTNTNQKPSNEEEPKVEVLKGKFKKKSSEIDASEGNPKLLSTVVPAVQRSVFGGRSQAPMNWNYPNKKIEDSIVEELPLGSIADDAPRIMKKQLQVGLRFKGILSRFF